MFMFHAALLLLFTTVVKINSETCTTPKNEEGNCTSLYTCPKLLSVLGNAHGEELVRKSRCGSTPNEPLVCCPLDTRTCITPNKKEGNCTSLGTCPVLLALLQTQQPDAIDLVRKSSCGVTPQDTFVCCPLGKTTTEKPGESLVPSLKYCGYQHSDDYDSLKAQTDITDFPWLAGLSYKNKDGREEVKCQGALISAGYVLTAGHCAMPPSDWSLKSIRLGAYDIKNLTDCVVSDGLTECSDPVQEYGVEETLVHPRFEAKAWSENDIALIRLNRTIKEYSDYIRPICLPLPGHDPLHTGDIVLTSGWGGAYREPNTGIKKKVLNKVITNQDCLTSYHKVNGRLRIFDSQMCTQEVKGNTDFACPGDTGSPAMFSRKSQWYIEGINSFSSSRCGEGYPVVYTRVGQFVNWIRDSLKP